ncbi:hypothetical protein ACH4LS_11560 [Streptomyces luteogriseus]|uniref:hypothetical protein n=1 Tax=Streptomyces luteogriseus TaxID=68233 RepID=UPI0037969997
MAEAIERHDLINSKGQTTLTTLASESFADAVDLLWSVAMEDVDATEASALAALAAQAMARAQDGPARDMTGVDDDQWVEWLLRTSSADASSDLPAVERFGSARQPKERNTAWRLHEAASRIAFSAARVTSTAALALWRESWHAQGSVFLGDVLTYLRQREESGPDGPIVGKIGAALAEGARSRTADDPALVVVAHSMGGNIVYDLLSHLRPELECDVLVTVGSQVGVFAELGLLPAVSAPADPKSDRVPALANVGSWINVYDPNDPLAFVTAKIFAGSEDFAYSTGRGVKSSHSAYMRRPSFHHRLAERLRDCPLPSTATGLPQE